MQKKLLAEGFGTLVLTLAVLASVQSGASIIATPVIAGLVLGLFVYTIGHSSGAHINPAVTAGLWSIGKVSNRDAVAYIIVQMFGAFIALMIASNFLAGSSLTLAPESLMVLLAELIGMIVFTFGIAAVVYGKVADTASGLVIGGSLLLGILIAAHLGSAGILNPAVALGLGSLNVSYALGAIFGSMLGMNFYKRFII
jgi:aquaporin Z